MKRLTKLTLIVTSAVILVGSFTACQHHRDPEQRAEWIVEKVTNKLELDDVQQNNLKSLSDEMLNVRKAMKQQADEKHEQLQSMLEQPTIDQSQLLSIIQTHNQLINEHAPQVVSAIADFYNSLKPEQQAEIREFMQEHRDHHDHWGHHGKFY